jgi:hypothetical protein
MRPLHVPPIGGNTLFYSSPRSDGAAARQATQVLGGSLAAVGCAAVFGPCLTAYGHYGTAQTLKSFYDAYSDPSVGNVYRAGLNANGDVYGAIVTNSQFIHPYVRNGFEVFNSIVGEIGRRIPVD